MDIAGCWLRAIHLGFSIRRPVVVGPDRRPEGPTIVSAVMPERLGHRRMRNRVRRSKPATRRSRPGECLVRGKQKRNRAERRDKRRIHSIRHDTHQSLVYRAALLGTLGRAFGARKPTIND